MANCRWSSLSFFIFCPFYILSLYITRSSSTIDEEGKTERIKPRPFCGRLGVNKNERGGLVEAFEAARGTGHNETRRALRALIPPGSSILIQTLSYFRSLFLITLYWHCGFLGRRCGLFFFCFFFLGTLGTFFDNGLYFHVCCLYKYINALVIFLIYYHIYTMGIIQHDDVYSSLSPKACMAS